MWMGCCKLLENNAFLARIEELILQALSIGKLIAADSSDRGIIKVHSFFSKG